MRPMAVRGMPGRRRVASEVGLPLVAVHEDPLLPRLGDVRGAAPSLFGFDDQGGVVGGQLPVGGAVGPGRRPASTTGIAWLPWSASRKPPSAVVAPPVGWLSLAAVAGPPSPVEPDVVSVPATVVIVPAGETRRTASLISSAIRK